MNDWPTDMPTPTWRSPDDDVWLYCGDCLEILPQLPDGCVDCLVTDPPYDVNFQGKSTTVERGTGYTTADSSIGVGVVSALLPRVKRGVVFSGNRLMFQYPTPYELGAVYCPSGAGLGRWGFTVVHPMLFYGKGLPHTRQSPAGFESFERAVDVGHPCTKPLGWMEWAVRKSTSISDCVLDPFMGSGTTGVACVKLGRRFIGIEIEQI